MINLYEGNIIIFSIALLIFLNYCNKNKINGGTKNNNKIKYDFKTLNEVYFLNKNEDIKDTMYFADYIMSYTFKSHLEKNILKILDNKLTPQNFLFYYVISKKYNYSNIIFELNNIIQNFNKTDLNYILDNISKDDISDIILLLKKNINNMNSINYTDIYDRTYF